MAEYGREAEARGSGWLCVVSVTDRSSDMSSSKRVGGRKANSDGDGPDENSKTDAPAVTESPLQTNAFRCDCTTKRHEILKTTHSRFLTGTFNSHGSEATGGESDERGMTGKYRFPLYCHHLVTPLGGGRRLTKRSNKSDYGQQKRGGRRRHPNACVACFKARVYSKNVPDTRERKLLQVVPSSCIRDVLIADHNHMRAAQLRVLMIIANLCLRLCWA
ncbi:hypothetical protein T10_3231 [Trichinella papuae]|uniref:Uncharacterized protein n=1 Tax=Trichinella papuae TaxID=268474 RepID=A0A0V1N1T5_9BILA|nr:hypothetical protein T10_3231 [Trichinella papuae]